VLLAGSASVNYASASLAAAWHRHFELCFLFIGGDGVVRAHCPLVSATSLFILQTCCLAISLVPFEALDVVLEDIETLAVR
jgi:hypothetical protein